MKQNAGHHRGILKSPAGSEDVFFTGYTIMESLTIASTVLGYFDPGSGSLVLQALVGGTAGLVVFGNYVWKLVTNQLRQRG